MSEISILAIDLAKNSFQVCAVRGDGTIVSNRAVSENGGAKLDHGSAAILVVRAA